MENLLNLLKQYWKETFRDEKLSKIEYEEKSDCFYWIYQPLPGMKLEQGQILDSSTVLSKKFQFIQRLVEQDKIDNSKFYDKNILKGFVTLTKEEKSDSIIMNLSISDTPIADLINYLK